MQIACAAAGGGGHPLHGFADYSAIVSAGLAKALRWEDDRRVSDLVQTYLGAPQPAQPPPLQGLTLPELPGLTVSLAGLRLSGQGGKVGNHVFVHPWLAICCLALPPEARASMLEVGVVGGSCREGALAWDRLRGRGACSLSLTPAALSQSPH